MTTEADTMSISQFNPLFLVLSRRLFYVTLLVSLAQLSGAATVTQRHATISKKKIRERITTIVVWRIGPAARHRSRTYLSSRT